ncbi:hypothetical protein DTL42_13370 [Bremerella cremea]|uniref:Uncharacterized protein n=1 Tax=Bremerella cremea TaxID=1031537 RepID=A0A368KQF3_9BACT|nr:hypothetical protein [Bremerella cremea]RCS48309.1 hypothetical protein DTL42_13370 [Bremerella cremea]
MGSLLWKQWRENRGYLLLFSAWMVLGAVYCVGYEVAYQFRAAVGGFSSVTLLYAMCAALFLAMRTAQGEQTDGTLVFSASLPVSLRRIAGTRLASAAATLAIPILLGGAIIALALISGLIEQASPRPFPYLERLPQRETGTLLTSLEQLASVTAIAVLGGIQLLLIISVIGCWLRSQAQAGFMGVLVTVAFFIFEGIMWYGPQRPAIAQLVYGAFVPQSLVVQWGYAEEIGSYTDHELALYRWPSLGLAVGVQLLLGILFTTQYGRLREPATEKGPGRWRWWLPAVWSYVPIRLPSRLLAMIWLELRQAFPLVIYGFLLCLLVTGVTVSMEDLDTAPFGDSFRSQFPHTVFFMGMIWSIVVAAGIYSSDLGEGLGTFWRSRPISPGMWFWTKYVVGLVMVLMVLDGGAILVAGNAPHKGPTEGMSWAFVACFPILHAWLYTLAVLGTCWTRKPVIGGFLAIAADVLLTIIVTAFPATNWMEPVNVYNHLHMAELAGEGNLLAHGYPVVFGTLVVSICLVAWLASYLARPLQRERGWLRLAT